MTSRCIGPAGPGLTHLLHFDIFDQKKEVFFLFFFLRDKSSGQLRAVSIQKIQEMVNVRATPGVFEKTGRKTPRRSCKNLSEGIARKGYRDGKM